MLNSEMSAIQQSSKKLQRIISETSSFNSAILQHAFDRQIYDSEGRKLLFRKVLDRQYGSLGQHDKVRLDHVDATARSSRSSNATPSSATSTPTKGNQQLTDNLDTLPRRVLIIFVRHFLCGLCQEYLARLSAHPSFSNSNLAENNLCVAIIGCGSPSYIPSYRALNKVPKEWGIYTDPSAELYDTLGMHRSLKMGDRRPVYIQRTMTGTMLRSIVQGVRRVPKGDVGRAGGWAVNGGEFLFEESRIGDNDGWHLRWSHRMENSRDHTEVEDLIAVMGFTSTTNSLKNDVRTHLQDGIPKLHNRSQSTPVILKNAPMSISDESRTETINLQAPIKRQFSLRRTLSTKRQSWLAGRASMSGSNPAACSKGGACLSDARARELL